MKTTVRIRCQSVETGVESEVEVPATVVGKHFAVHREFLGWTISDREAIFDKYTWNVTHLPSGFRAAQSPYKRSAMHAARQLAAIEVPWATMTAEDARALRGPVLDQIMHIRGLAKIGAIP
jgi:hypothetical protein